MHQAVQATKVAVKIKQSQPHSRYHVWVHMNWAGTIALKSFQPVHSTAYRTTCFPRITAATTGGRSIPRHSRRVYRL